MDKASVFFCLMFGLVVANQPNGVYHQEYNFKTSSSSFKNNELQHKNDDSGYYSKDGDLAGRVKPKINSHSQHEEYVNPKLNQQGGNRYDQNGNLLSSSSFGSGAGYNQYGAANTGGQYDISDSLGASSHQYGLAGTRSGSNTYGLASSTGSRSYDVGSSPYSSLDNTGSSSSNTGYSSSGSYGSSQSYGVNSNLKQILRQLENDLARQLQDAIYNQHRESSAYSSSISSSQLQADRRELEDELRRNFTARLDDVLKTEYGTQGIRGSNSYSINNGRLGSTANYNNQELTDLTEQAKNNLNRQLNDGMQVQYRTQSSSSSSSYSTNNAGSYQQPQQPNYNNQYPTSSSPHHTVPYRQPEPITSNSGPIKTVLIARPIYQDDNTAPYQSPRPQQHNQYPTIPYSYPQTSSINSESITAVATKVQENLDEQLNRLLEDTQRRYFASDSAGYHQSWNFDTILTQLEDDLKRNLTTQFDNEFARRGTHNYNVNDIGNLKGQIERNLLDKLLRNFNRQKNDYYKTYTSSSSSSSSSSNIASGGAGRVYQTNPSYTYYPTSPNTQVSPIKTATNYNNNYNQFSSGSQHQLGYGGSASTSQIDLNDLQRQLQDKLSSQVRAAITQNQHSNSYAGSSSLNSQDNYQANLQDLTNELNRNLTDEINLLLSQHYGRQYSSSADSSAQFANLKNQLQGNLQKELQQGLQQSYSRHSSWSSSSSYNYRPTRGYTEPVQVGAYQNLRQVGQVQANAEGEDCLYGDDSSSSWSGYNTKQPIRRQTRSAYHSDNHRLTYGYGENNNRRFDYDRQHQLQLTGAHDDVYNRQRNTNSPHRVDDSDLTQQTEDIDFPNERNEDLTQHTDSDLTQQTEDIDFPNERNEDFTQQTEDIRLETSANNRRRQSTIRLGQHTDDTEEIALGKLETGNQQRPSQIGQETDDSDLTQQTEEIGFGKLEIGSQQKPRTPQSWQQTTNSDLTQQTEEIGFGKLEIGSQQKPRTPQTWQQTGQQTDDSDLTQQTEDIGFGKLEIGSQQKPRTPHSWQQTTNSDLTQQTEEIGFGKLEIGSQQKPRTPQTWQQTGQQTDDSDLTQQTEEIGFGKLEIGSQQKPRTPQTWQQTTNSDLTQQTEENGFGKLEIGSQQKPRTPHTWQQTGQQTDNSDLTQQTEEIGFGKLEIGSQQKPRTPQTWQQTDDSDLTQQTEETGFGKLEINSQQKPKTPRYSWQQPDNSDLTQKTEQSNVGKLEGGNHQTPVWDDQSQEPTEPGLIYRHPNPHNSYGKLEIGNHQTPLLLGTQHRQEQETDTFDLTQKTEQANLGKLEVGNHQVPAVWDDQSQEPTEPGLIYRWPKPQNQPQSVSFVSGSQYKPRTNRPNQQSTLELEQTDLTQRTENNNQRTIDDSDLTQQAESVTFQRNIQTQQENRRRFRTEMELDLQKPLSKPVITSNQQQIIEQPFEPQQENRNEISKANRQTEDVDQVNLDKAISQSHELVNKLREKFEQQQSSRTFQQQSASQQEVRVTYNPRIVHYPNSYTGSRGYVIPPLRDPTTTTTYNQNTQSRDFIPNLNAQSHHNHDYNSNDNEQSTTTEFTRRPGQLYYGIDSQVDDEKFGTVSEIEPISPQRATVIQPVYPSPVSVSSPVLTGQASYSGPRGVKTSRVSSGVIRENADVEFIPVEELTTSTTTTTAKPGFWKRIGNTVKEKLG